MSQRMPQDTPLQNCTNTLNQSPASSKDTPMLTPMKQSKLFDFIDLTGASKQAELRSPSSTKAFAFVIDEIVISDSDDESPPKRLKHTQTPESTPKKPILISNSHLQPFKNVTSNRTPILTPKISSTLPSKTVSNSKKVKHSTPVQENGDLSELKVSSPTLGTVGTNSRSRPGRVSDILRSTDMPNVFEEEQLMPTDITTVELFASFSSANKTQFKKGFAAQFRESCNENSNNSSLPEPDFLISESEQRKTQGSQLAEQLNQVGIKDSPEQKLNITPQTPKNPSPESCCFFTPNGFLVNSSEKKKISTPFPFEPSSHTLTLDKMENNRNRYIPNRIHSHPCSHLIEERELPVEWIDHMINLPLESRTTFIKISSLQFVHSYITTPRVKITTSLLAPLVACLVQSEDEMVILPVSTLLCNVIKTHPVITPANIGCYTSVFTWEILTSSLEAALGTDQLLVPVDNLLKLYCDVMESENSYSPFRDNNKLSFIRELFWPSNSNINLSSHLKSLMDYVSKLFFKQNTSVTWLFKMLEQVLEWSMEQNEVIWHIEATSEFCNQFSRLDSQSYSQLIESINPPWFAGYLAQKRLQELCVSPKLNLQFSSTLSDFFLNYSDLLPSHTYHDAPAPIQIPPLDSLIKASHYGDCKAINQLIRDGCNPNACDVKKWSSLHRACYSGEIRSIEAIVQASKEKGIYLNIIQQNALGATPLHIAAKCGNTNVCKCLLNIGGPSLLFHRDGNQKIPSQVATDIVLINLLTEDWRDGTFSIHSPSANSKHNSNLRIPIDSTIIREFELMFSLSIYGLFIQGRFTDEDLLACQKAEHFLLDLKIKINRSQSQPVELRKLTTLVYSLFA